VIVSLTSGLDVHVKLGAYETFQWWLHINIPFNPVHRVLLEVLLQPQLDFALAVLVMPLGSATPHLRPQLCSLLKSISLVSARKTYVMIP
ncbi:hypothetical protein BHM03_00061323, partial [Ensete ventricosum]